MSDMVIVEVPIPASTLSKLMVAADMDKTTVAHLASQAIQEWVQLNFGKRVPGNSRTLKTLSVTSMMKKLTAPHGYHVTRMILIPLHFY